MKQSHFIMLIVFLGLTTKNAIATEISEATRECYIQKIEESDKNLTVDEIKAFCKQQVTEQKNTQERELSALEKRIVQEQQTRDNPAVITPHKRNYLLPISYVNNPNASPFENLAGDAELDNFEAKFQLSFKAPLAESLFQKKDVLFFGFTIQSYWQMYNSEVSSPFRETNYQPEIFYGFMNDFKVGEWTNLVNVIGIEHQSNGRSQPLSRSWNRLYAQFVWENNDWIFMFKPWYRIPEDRKTEPNQADGDDNPDIHKYMGYFEFTSLYRWDTQTFGIMLRNNLRSDNRGAIQLDWTFPMGKRFKGYAQYFHGYGESLIDYDHSTSRLGIGVLLTDIF
ncbi:phospholipase A [Aliikangiella coralliicola]|uniref:Phospholipase A1 n=1 Tax=Aliikangiella coralliicola TaxID=2592383 RepID=A0A545U608_9GAMM|nr:phospholipase A [Aliikangiella coralliicola]TQV84896.1 phospholipase A [Aliikangiella coralliicola]